MKITDLLKSDLVYLRKTFASKNEAIQFFSKELKTKGYASSGKKVYDLFLEREAQVSTGVGDKIAMPHIRDNVMKQNKLFFAKIAPLDWQSPDNQAVEYVIGIALSKAGGENSHLTVIANLSKLLINPSFVKELENATKKSEILKIFAKYDQVLEKQENVEVETFESVEKTYDIVAVTACPTGIAHTFMAAERLEKMVQEKGLSIKVETQGTQGAKNALTEADIAGAKGVILALDRAIDTGRFKNHDNVVETTTRKAIHEPEKLLKDSLDGKGIKLKNITSSNESSDQSSLSFNGFGKRAYRSILTGVSYMLPFVIFGGILIALAFLIDLFYVWAVIGDLSKIDNSFGSMVSASKWFMTLGGAAFGLMVPILAAYITYAIVGKAGLLPGFIVGLMATGKMNPLLDSIGLSFLVDVNSGFFGAIGGAFLAAAIIILLSMWFQKASKSWQGIINILVIPLFGTLAVASIFWFANIPFQFLNDWFTKLLQLLDTNSQYIGWLLGLLIGIMMAFDLGGPINKAAYVFGTTSLATVLETGGGAGSLPMGVAIISGMVPPLAIAVSAIVSKKYWSQDERKSAQTNWILGFSFISEGAIPFTAAKPKVMVVSNIVGGGVSGLVAGLLGVGALAPHGGIFILPLFRSNLFSTASNQLIFGMLFMLAALAAGTIAQVVLMKFLLPLNDRKTKNEQVLKALKKGLN